MLPNTRKTARRAPVEESKYTQGPWFNGTTGGPEDLTLPSGQVVLVRRPGMEGLIAAGVLKNMDALSALVNTTHIRPKTGPGGRVEVAEPTLDDVRALMQDEGALAEIITVVDKVVVHCVIRPVLARTPNDVTLREPGVIYTDMVDLNDKMFLFNYVVGGTRDYESFRTGLHATLGGLESGQDLPSEAESDLRGAG